MKRYQLWPGRARILLREWALTFTKEALAYQCLNCQDTLESTYREAAENRLQPSSKVLSSSKVLCYYCDQLHQQSLLPQPNACLRCALPLVTVSDKALHNSLICAECQIKSPAFSRCVASCIYEGVPAQLVRRCKHQAKTSAIGMMANQIEATLTHRFPGLALMDLVDCLIPVPLHAARERKRGFNQAGLLAHALGERLKIDVVENACQRVINSRGQQTLDRKTRKNNLKQVFKATPARVAGKRIAIIDDVVTTGATADELAQELLSSGALDCQIWCYARTAKPD